MSAELLRRAATKLREHAEDGLLPTAPWDAHKSEWREGMFEVAGQGGDEVCGATSKPDADYIAMLHPPVALALARLLDMHAQLVEASATAGESFIEVFALGELLDIARAILREDS